LDAGWATGRETDFLETIGLFRAGPVWRCCSRLFLLIHRGFRAATPPPPWEVAVARGLRNFAIPSSERNEKDPVPASSESLRRARDLFLSRCAGCHGPDGSGRTPIGSNVYPRVPDLRSTPTQNLTDGELHYIIANGVQLTGMPALSGTGSSVEAWELVRFVRSLRVLDQKQQVQDVTNLTSAHYTGSQSCEK
jgi:mono/diheme cytochrome c family protein